jgi:8-oxo-dGTP diphosphatase
MDTRICIIEPKERRKMYTLYYGTNNAAKVNFMSTVLNGLPITIKGLYEIENIDHTIDESGKDPLENAKIKALHYYRQINAPVFSIDSGLFFENVAYADQPGTHIRRVNGVKLTDAEMITYYSRLADTYGGELIGYYKNAICIILDNDTILENDGEKINSERFIITAKPHKKLVEGWPLDSLSKEIQSGNYYHDINREMNNNTDDEFRKIFSEVLEKLHTRCE